MKPRARAAGFTLIEIMIVIMILGLVLTVGIPSFFHGMNRESMRKTVAEVVEICSHTRAQAILSGSMKELVIRPGDGTLSIGGAPAAPPGDDNPANGVRIPERIRMEMVDVNFQEYKELEEARVRFYPNGTSDEFTLVLESDKQEFRKITLDVVTGLAEVEVIR
jgi:prepilin-type N-terminal cleavage/methylation domain-containing protein